MIVIENGAYVECRCANCSSRIGVHEKDIAYDDANPRMPEFSAKCGACGATVAVPAGSMPPAWIRRLAPQGA